MKVIRISFYALIFFIFLLLVLGLTLPVDKEPEILPSYQGRHISLSDINIRAHQIGNGPDVLLIHGSPGSIEDFQPLINDLSKRYRITRYDRPAHGFSSSSQVSYSLSQNADIALELIERLDLKDVIVIGHSYGGTTGLMMATKQPDTVSAFITLNAPIQVEKAPEILYTLLNISVIGKGIIHASRLLGDFIGKMELEKNLIKAFSPNLDYLSNDFISQRQTLWLQPKVSLAIAKEKLRFESDLITLNQTFHLIKQPVYILQSDDDLFVPSTNGRLINEKIADSELTTLADAGHYVQHAYPDKVIELIDRVASSQ